MLLATIYATIIVVSSFIIYYLLQIWKYRSIRHLATSPGSLPFLGCALDFLCFEEGLQTGLRYVKVSGNKFVAWIGPDNVWLAVSDREMTEFFLRSPKFITKAENYKYTVPWLGNGVFTADSSSWHKQRKTITPAFHFQSLEKFLPIFNSECDILIQVLRKEVGNKACDITPYLTTYTLDIICETAMGVKINAQKHCHTEFAEAVKYLSNLIIRRTISAWMRYDCLFRFSNDYYEQKKALAVVNGLTNEVLQRRKEELKMEKEGNNNALYKVAEYNPEDVYKKKKHILIDNIILETNMTDEEIKDEVNTILFAGQDTTSSTLSLMLFALAENPDVQKKIVEELKNIYGDDRDRAVELQDISQMRYMELVIKEVLRYYSPVPMIARKLTENVEYKGTVYPKDLNIMFFLYALHRSPDFYENPEKFDPERFSSTKDNKPYAYIPFSAGPRNCLGQKYAMYELKLTIARLLRHFEFVSAGPEYKMQLSPEMVMKSLNGINIIIRQRNF